MAKEAAGVRRCGTADAFWLCKLLRPQVETEVIEAIWYLNLQGEEYTERNGTNIRENGDF